VPKELSSAGDAPETEILDLYKLVDAVLRTFSTETRFFDAAEGRDLGGYEPGINADNAGLQRFSNSPNA